MPEIPYRLIEPTHDYITQGTINQIILYLEADKKLRDEQFEAILKSFNAAGVVLKDLVDIELENK